MNTPGFPVNEKARLRALHSLEILDTEPEERFDRLTRMARRVFGVSTALVSLVDENRQWFKSKVGLEASETGRDISFCGHAILGHEIFVIENALEDERFADNPLVTGEPHIRFYAGVPLRYHDGSTLGTLCIIDQSPRTLDEQDLATFRDLAAMAEAELRAIELATIDELTKISNRRGFLALAQNSISLCARQEMPVSVVFFDLDKFKTINDTYGHAEGDRVLLAFSELMRSVFRDSDVFGRIGGDEFAVVLTGAREEMADAIVTRFRTAVEGYNLLASRGYDIEFSDGAVSMMPDQNTVLEDILNDADELMYQQKQGGASTLQLARGT